MHLKRKRRDQRNPKRIKEEIEALWALGRACSESLVFCLRRGESGASVTLCCRVSQGREVFLGRDWPCAACRERERKRETERQRDRETERPRESAWREEGTKHPAAELLGTFCSHRQGFLYLERG